MFVSRLSLQFDKFAISLSALCVVHCLLTPVLVSLIPTLAALGIADEGFHLYLIFAVIPLSLVAALMGCKKHKRYGVAFPILGGLFILVLTAGLGHEILGDTLEKVLTIIGACVISFGHVLNYRLCRKKDCGEC